MNSRLSAALTAFLLLAACTAPNPPPGTRRTGTGGSTVTEAMRADPLVSGDDRVYFDLDRAVIRDDARATLDRQAAWMNRNPGQKIQIAGNCDERGTSEYNLALGGRRAYAAYTYLLAKNVPAARMTATSFGKELPALPGSSEASWAKNRNAITSAQ